ncbi:hypothetical protein M1B72_11075 [Geomonas paludis]|nr:hypothetical protein [Geomonas paludis]UPU38225.1 hypothetical protein M1B72_11075 [Geomonas paludis]
MVAALVVNLAVDGMMGEHYYTGHVWPKVVAVALSAAIVWFVGRRLNAGPGRALVDKETGEEVLLKKTHTFFFIKMEYWAFAIVVLGVFIAAR